MVVSCEHGDADVLNRENSIFTDSACIILAAGKGTRMKSDIPKVLHKIAGQSMIDYVIGLAALEVSVKRIVVVYDGSDLVKDAIYTTWPDVSMVLQKDRTGTASAVMCAKSSLSTQNISSVFVFFGDTPFVKVEHIQAMLHKRNSGADVVVIGFITQNSKGYGRLRLCERTGRLLEIIEDIFDTERNYQDEVLCNSGVMCINAKVLFDMTEEIMSDDNNIGEYKLTDIISIANSWGMRCEYVQADCESTMGVNSMEHLAMAEDIFQKRKRTEVMNAGVTLLDSDSTYFSYDTKIETGVVIEPHVFFGENVVVEKNARVRAFSYIEDSHICRNATVGPFARLRSSVIGCDSRIGNFVEVKKSRLCTGVKVCHLSYIGDTDIGEGTNIGAGVITCNYDGERKHNTEIGKGAFVGSMVALVAPVNVGDGAYIACGSVITEDVPDDAFAIRRQMAQVVKVEYAPKLRKRCVAKTVD